MTEDEIRARIVESLAAIRAVDVADLQAEIDQVGIDGCELTSHEVVAILVDLQPVTGLDPEDRDVLAGCDAQTLTDLSKLCVESQES